MNTRKKGNHWENEVKHYLEMKGYFTQLSRKSEFPDIIALPPLNDPQKGKATMLIECKTTKEGFSKREIQALISLAAMYNCRAYIAYPQFSPYSKERANVVLREVLGEPTA